MLDNIISALLLVLHPFYVSITSVDYNEQAQRVEISCRIFYDDLEAALKSGRNMKVDLMKPTDKPATDSLLAAYLRDHFRLSVNGKPSPLHYVGYEIEDDVAWCFLEADNIRVVNNIAITNRILFDQFPKQSNILHVTAYGQRKSKKLDNPERSVAFEW